MMFPTAEIPPMMRSAFVLLLFAMTTHAEDWPGFRGPTGQGIVREGSMPVEWSSKTATWKQALPGNGWSSPIIVRGKIYLTAAVADQKDFSLRTLCLDVKDGKTLWNVEVFKEAAGAPRPHSKNSHASPTPLVEGDRLYVHFGHQGTACLDLSGKVLWKTVQRYSPVHGNGGTPVLVDGLLIFSCDGAANPYVVALDAATGKEIWKTPRQGNAPRKFSFSTPLVIDVKGQKQVISAGSNQVTAFEPKTGKEIWTVTYDGYSVIPRPVFGHGLVILSTGYDAPSLLAIKPDGKGDVTKTHVAWTARKGAPHTPSPLLVGDEVYMVSDNGTASCLDAKTGKVHWSERVGGSYSASPIFADGKVYFQSEDGVTTVVKASTKFEEVAKNKMNERTLASFAVADGALYLRTEQNLYRFDAK
jgi:outer membrane protein assembly factor BamB